MSINWTFRGGPVSPDLIVVTVLLGPRRIVSVGGQVEQEGRTKWSQLTGGQRDGKVRLLLVCSRSRSGLAVVANGDQSGADSDRPGTLVRLDR